MADEVRFPYLRTKNTIGETILRPVTPITLPYKGASISANALLDTGADINVLPYSPGIALGADWAAQKLQLELSGNLSRFETRGIAVSATIGKFRETLMAFAWTQAEQVPLILGQTNFFDEFDVCFQRTENTIEVRQRLISRD